MATVRWSVEALEDVFFIRSYIAQFNPDAAEHVAARLMRATDKLARFPNIGPAIENGRRKLNTVWPYAILYRVDDLNVTILSVRHGARTAE